MTHFVYPWLLILLPLPFVLPHVLPKAGMKNQDALKIPFFDALTALPSKNRSVFSGGSGMRKIFGVLVWILLSVSAARPQWTGEPVSLPVEGRNIFLVLDVSGSMAEKDFEDGRFFISRWEAVKRVAKDFIQKRSGDRIGVVLFGSRAYRFLPLTPDLNTAAQMLDEAGVGLAGTQTAVGDGLLLALKELANEPEKSKVVILLSDGVANAGKVRPDGAATVAAKEKVKVYTIGAGSEPVEFGGFFGTLGAGGAEIDEESLKRIAQMTGGAYFRAADYKALQSVYKTIDALEPVKKEDLFVRPVKELYYFPLAGAFFISVAGVLLTMISWAGEKYRE